jgi:hypothetical protein
VVAILLGSAIAGVAMLWVVGLLVPAEKMLPEDVPTVLVAEGCHGAAPHVAAALSPDLGNRLVTVVVPMSTFGRSEIVNVNCQMLAMRIRERHPGMRLVPRRAICLRIQRWGRTTTEIAHRSFGQIVWFVDGEIVAKRDEHPVLTRLGLAYEDLPNGGYRLVSTR